MAATIHFTAGCPLGTHGRRIAKPAAPPCSSAPATMFRRASKRGFSLCAGSFSASDIVGDIQSSVNGRDMKALGEIWSEDCLVENFSFSKPFQGKKEVTEYFGKLADAMGENINLVTEVVYEGEETTAAVWHLEWKGKKIPFTRGCSIYHLPHEPGEKPLIRRAFMAVEWPLKPGALSLEVLKIVASTFDSLPRLAETTLGFLQKSDAVSQLLMNLWRTWVNPLILSLLMSYTGIWAHSLKILRRLVLLLLEILKKFM